VQLKKKLGVIQSHVEGLLEQGGIKLSAVVSDLFGVSGWAMLEHIAQGVTDVEVLAGEARGVLRKKDAQLKEALAGHLEPIYRLLLRQHLEQVRLLRRQVEEINQALAEAMKEHLAALHRLSKIPGVDLYAAQELLSEIGPKAAAFASPEKFTSWVGSVPAVRNRRAFPTAIARPRAIGICGVCSARLPGPRFTPRTLSSLVCSPG